MFPSFAQVNDVPVDESKSRTIKPEVSLGQPVRDELTGWQKADVLAKSGKAVAVFGCGLWALMIVGVILVLAVALLYGIATGT